MIVEKILAVFGNVAFFLQERANLQVFKLLRNFGCDLLLVVNIKLFIFKCELAKHQIISTIRIIEQKFIIDEFFKRKYLDLYE